MSLRIVPGDDHASSFSHIRPKQKGAPSAPGLHDTLRAGVGANALDTYSPETSSAAGSAHPLEARLKAWEATQEGVRMESLRRTFGIAEPVRRGMELKIVRDGEWRPLALGGGVPSVHEEILRGKEHSISWEDIYSGEEQRAVVPVHDELERKLKI
ncbi:putative proteasome maturation factor ump1 protein [Phaeoacremonium minimum UCRPA7]|uniref:Putative proteasome maturation factor ump1 protein n=1 Tax=Phaeoacremonium minimum (strain UCR-PA7) TaxID=1286976 RepID=R8BWT1_PHAM7|nr:putative proteasome maturation factor ump1 protein [Phaeoacremonium minimum UCRPA7]EOO03759.1 putative proteasome maturation factor ump1 protein [Phaeoacremonium minimum UCRPA7]